MQQRSTMCLSVAFGLQAAHTQLAGPAARPERSCILMKTRQKGGKSARNENMKSIFKKIDSKTRKFRCPIAAEREALSAASHGRRQFDPVAYGAALEVLG